MWTTLAWDFYRKFYDVLNYYSPATSARAMVADSTKRVSPVVIQWQDRCQVASDGVERIDVFEIWCGLVGARITRDTQ